MRWIFFSRWNRRTTLLPKWFFFCPLSRQISIWISIINWNFKQIYHLALDCLLIALKFEVSLCLSMRYLTIRTTAPQIAKPNKEPTIPTTMYCFILAYRVNLSLFNAETTLIFASRFSSAKSLSINASQQVSISEHRNRAFSIFKLVPSSSRDSERWLQILQNLSSQISPLVLENMAIKRTGNISLRDWFFGLSVKC